MILNQLNGRRVCAGPVRPLSFWVLFAVFVAFAVLHWTVRAAGVSVPDGAPPWALSAKNLEYHPVDGVSLIAYVNPSTGNDSTGDVYTFAAANGDFRKKPAAIDPFLTTDAAIAAVGREGPHAVLLAAGLTHTSPITSGGCEGASAAHPFLIGAYWPSGTIPATAAGQMAILDPGLENAAAAITTVRPAHGDVFFMTKTDDTIAAFASFHKNFCAINKHNYLYRITYTISKQKLISECSYSEQLAQHPECGMI